MKTITGNIWKFHKENNYIIIPTNLGFTKNLVNVMGRGLALQCKNKFNGIDNWYGAILHKRFLNNDNRQIAFDNVNHLIFFATKPIIKETPNLSWKQDSSIETIEKSCQELSYIFRSKQITNSELFNNFNFYLPLVGCGNGNLKKDEILPILDKYFSEFNNVFIVENNFNSNLPIKKKIENKTESSVNKQLTFLGNY